MEWVETTGRTVDEAKDQALDRLGVDESDAEFEVVEEAKQGLFGRVRREARVRARVRPTQPRPKVDRRDRRRSKRQGGKRHGSKDRDRRSGSDTAEVAATSPAEQGEPAAAAKPSGGGERNRSGRSSNRRRGKKSTGQAAKPDQGQDRSEQSTGDEPVSNDEVVTLEQQGDIVEAFLDGLLDAFDLDGELRRTEIDDEMLELGIEGDDLGLLIGPKGQTLSALQELSRTVVLRKAPGPHQGRFRLDVSGYRQRRREALSRFTTKVAEEVVESGLQKALEPMGAADRKIVHDTVNEIAGVSTISEGDEPRRRVVIVPEG